MGWLTHQDFRKILTLAIPRRSPTASGQPARFPAPTLQRHTRELGGAVLCVRKIIEATGEGSACLSFSHETRERPVRPRVLALSSFLPS